MTVNFEFITPTQILFGEDKALEAGRLAIGFGNPALVISGSSPSRIAYLFDAIRSVGVELVHYLIEAEPTVGVVQRGVNLGLKKKCQSVIAIGGGSVLDAAKAIAVLMANEGEIYDYLEVIGKGKTLAKPGVALIAIPTTAGTGAEVTRNAVIGSPEHGVKVSLRSPYMLAKVAIIDPKLTYSMPESVTASTGMDALTQLVEPFVSTQANPLTDAVCREGMQRAARSLLQAYQDGSDTQARVDMALASLMSGLALANAKLGIVHGFASVLGGMLDAPHGAICARLLPSAMSINLMAIQARGASQDAISRFDQIAQVLTGQSNATAREGVAWLKDLGDTLQIPPLSHYGLKEQDFRVIIERTSVASSTKGNPITLTEAEMNRILMEAF